MVFIKFGMESDPSRPLQLIFGSKSSDQDENCSQYSTTSQGGKQSIAIVPVHLKAKPAGSTSKNKEISPIEVFTATNALMVCTVYNADYYYSPQVVCHS